jgi:hypothetical protein
MENTECGTNSDLINWAQSNIYDIQNGYGLDKDYFPKNMMGEIAKEKWNDPNFSYGMEYGYILAMIDLMDEISGKTY